MIPEISLGPLTLQTFGLMFAASFIVSGWIVHMRLGEIGKPPDWAYEMVFAALIGGLIGARLYFIVDNYSDVKEDLLGNIFSGSGLTWYGGAVGGALGVVLWAWWRKFLNLWLLDLAAPALAAGYAVGRIGCQLSGDGDYGKPWDGPWAMSYENGTVPTPPGVPVHPTPIYETLCLHPLAAQGKIPGRHPLRDLSDLCGCGEIPRRVPEAQRGHGPGPDHRAAREPGDDDRRPGLDRRRQEALRDACPPGRSDGGRRCTRSEGIINRPARASRADDPGG